MLRYNLKICIQSNNSFIFHVQALPLDASELRQLPGIESEDDIAAFKRAKVTSLRSLLRLPRPTVESMLMSLPTFKRKSSLMNEAFRFLGNIPIYDAKMNVTCTFTSARVEVPECVFGDESTALPIITLPLDTECTLEIQFTQTHGNSQNHGRPITFHDPKYHKAKEASWWVVLGSMSTNELLVTKRTSIASGRQASVTVEFVTSIESIPDDMCLFVLSDCLIGVDMKYAFTIQT